MSKSKEVVFGGGDGINPNTAKALFSIMVKNGWTNQSYADFRSHAGRNLRCFAKDSRWIPGQKFRDYFASFNGGGGAALRAFHTLWEHDAHKKGKKTLNAYDDPKKGTGNGTRKGSASRTYRKSDLAAMKAEIDLLDRLIERRVKLDALREKIAA